MIDINISINFDDFNFSTGELRINDEEVTVLFGDSGCGKSTILNCISGREKRYNGSINFEKNLVIGYVFQENSLFPHLSIEENLSYALRRCHNPRYTFEDIVKSLSVGHLLKKSVHSLSGGEAQRVSIARALLSSPDILLLDEPLSALHSKAKKDILNLIRTINRDYKLPIVLVTHSMKEVVSLCDSVIYMKEGLPPKKMDRKEALLKLDPSGPINSIEKESISRLGLSLNTNDFEHLVIHSSNIIPLLDIDELNPLSNSISCTLDSIESFDNENSVLKLKYLEDKFLYAKINKKPLSRFSITPGQKVVALFGPDSHII